MNWKVSALMLLASAEIVTGEILNHCDDQTVREVLTQEVSELEISSLELIGVGWDNWVAEVNHEWIFRFPRRESVSRIFRREDALLQALAPTVSIAVPHYEYKGSKTDFVGYRKIPGGDLTEEAYLGLSDEKKATLADTLAEFLVALHRALPLEQARELGFEELSYDLEMLSSLKGSLPSNELEQLLEESLRAFRSRDSNSRSLVLTHGDLCPENVAFDAERGVLNGVFDFTDATIASVSSDLQKLFLTHPQFVKAVAESYAEKTGERSQFAEAAQDFVLTRYTYLNDARSEGNKEREQQMIADLSRYLKLRHF